MNHEKISFFSKLNNAIALNQSLLVVGLDPNLEMMPKKYVNTSNLDNQIDSLWEWLQFIIEQTHDRVCAYKPTFGFYKALGVAGMELLDRILKAIPQEIPIILDAKHGDLNSSTIFARTVFQDWQVDALTLSPFAGIDGIAPFLVYPDKAAFILCRTSNPGAIVLQEYPSDNPFYLQVIREARSWGTPEQLGLEVGTTEPETIAKVRAIAPERIILIRSIWEKAANFDSLLKAGLNENGTGLLIPVPQDMLASDRLAEQIQLLNREVDRTRNEVMGETSSCYLWTSDVCLLAKHPHQDLILQLFDIGCLLFGEYVQANGATFSYYVDLRAIISNPQVFNQVLNAYAEVVRDLEFDRIAGIPYGSLPTATGLSLQLQRPMIYPRKEVKAHGTRRLIEGNYHPGEKVVVVDDILISGKSAIEGVEKLESAGLVVEDVVVLIDHQSGGKDRLKKKGYRSHCVLTIAEITEILYESGRLNEEQYQSLKCD
jgi:uridine monophosphate synthetase